MVDAATARLQEAARGVLGQTGVERSMPGALPTPRSERLEGAAVEVRPAARQLLPAGHPLVER